MILFAIGGAVLSVVGNICLTLWYFRTSKLLDSVLTTLVTASTRISKLSQDKAELMSICAELKGERR